MKALKLIAIWMIILVITIPVYASASVNLAVNYYYGNDRINGFRKRADNTTASIDAMIDGDAAITTNQTVLGVGSYNYYFDSCSPKSSGTFTCTFSKFSVLGVNELQYSIRLYNDAKELVWSEPFTMSVDNKPPAVELISVSPKLSSAPSVSYSFSVRDTDHDNGAGCSGISRVDVYFGDYSGIPIKTFTPNTESCTYSNNATYNFTASSPGMRSICIRAYDRFSQESIGVNCDSFVFDNQAPVISGLEILDAINLSPVRYMGEQEVPAIVRVNVSGDDISNVWADLTSINPANAYINRSYDSVINNGNNRFSYVWNVVISISSSRTPSITVRAVDNAGNSASRQLSSNQIVFDNSGPSVSSITTGLERNGIIYASSKATFRALVNENSLTTNRIYLDLSNIGGSSADMADYCNKTSAAWECFWLNRTIAAPHGTATTIKSTIASEDDLGNSASAVKEANITIDKLPPIVSNINITKIAGEYDYGQNITVKGDHLNIIADVIEDSDALNAFGNFSMAISTARNEPGQCSRLQDNNWRCSWQTPAIDASGPYDANLYFRFVDIANNVLTIDDQIKVFALGNDTLPNHWSHGAISCSPALVDRQVATFANQRVFCHIPLQPLYSQQNPKIMLMALDRCSDAINGSVQFLQDASLMNNEPGSTDPYLKITLKAIELKIDRLSLNCPLRINTKVADTIFTSAEVENITIDIGLFNLPAGELSKDIEQKVNSSISDATGTLWEIISLLNKLFFYAERICNLVNLVFQVMGIFEFVHASIASAEAAGGPVVMSTMEGTRIEMCFAKEKQKEAIADYYKIQGKWYCQLINCRASPMPRGEGNAGDLEKWGSWIGGGGGISRWLQEGGAKTGGVLDTGFIKEISGKDPSEYMNVKDSIVWSVLTFCIPGIVYNLDKYRQVLCLYASCMKDSADYGMPISECESVKSYQECKYIFGEIFNIIPFVHLYNYYINLIKNSLSDPFALLGFAGGIICAATCPATPGTANVVCSWVKTVSMITETIAEIVGIFDMQQWKIQNDYCKSFDSDWFSLAAGNGKKK